MVKRRGVPQPIHFGKAKLSPEFRQPRAKQEKGQVPNHMYSVWLCNGEEGWASAVLQFDIREKSIVDALEEARGACNDLMPPFQLDARRSDLGPPDMTTRSAKFEELKAATRRAFARVTKEI